MNALVRAATLTNFLEVARDLGLNPQPLLREVGLSRALLADPEQRIPAASAVRLLEMAAQATGHSQFGLRMAESRQLSDFGVVSLLISHQPISSVISARVSLPLYSSTTGSQASDIFTSCSTFISICYSFSALLKTNRHGKPWRFYCDYRPCDACNAMRFNSAP